VTEEQRYRLRTPASARFFEEARRYLPGGAASDWSSMTS
jgi:hypothetical protein